MQESYRDILTSLLKELEGSLTLGSLDHLQYDVKYMIRTYTEKMDKVQECKHNDFYYDDQDAVIRCNDCSKVREVGNQGDHLPWISNDMGKYPGN